MTTITISQEKLTKVLTDVELLIKDVVSLIDQDEVTRRRLTELKADPSIARPEKELKQYLKERQIDVGMDS